MKAARLHQTGTPLSVEDTAEPVLQASSAIVRILSSHIPAFTHKVLSGELSYRLPELPFTPGTSAIGVVEVVADDVFGIEVGQTVFCDPLMSVPTQDGSTNGILIAWTGLGEDSARLQRIWKDGVWAEKAVWPAECLTPIPEIATPDSRLANSEALAAIGYLAIPYGGFLRGQLRPGQQVIVSGATGGLGSAAVLVALAMGASRVVAVGRNQTVLESLQQLDPQRVVGVSLTGDVEADHAELLAVAGSSDLMLDTLGGVKQPQPTLSCIRALRPGGTAVLMGGVQADIPLPYGEIMLKQISICGAFMYPRTAPQELLQMVQGGSLRLDQIQRQAFALSEIGAAIAYAAQAKGLNYAIVTPA